MCIYIYLYPGTLWCQRCWYCAPFATWTRPASPRLGGLFGIFIFECALASPAAQTHPSSVGAADVSGYIPPAQGTLIITRYASSSFHCWLLYIFYLHPSTQNVTGCLGVLFFLLLIAVLSNLGHPGSSEVPWGFNSCFWNSNPGSRPETPPKSGFCTKTKGFDLKPRCCTPFWY